MSLSLLEAPPDARACYVFAHGAGAGMNPSFMEALAKALAGRGIEKLIRVGEVPPMTAR